MRFSRFISGLAVAMAFVAGTASATPVPNMVINFTETQSGVNAAYTGSAIDLTGFIPYGNPTTGFAGNITPAASRFSVQNGSAQQFASYHYSGTVGFGTGGNSPPTVSVSGDSFGWLPFPGYFGDMLSLPTGYSGGTLSGSALWSSSTYQSLGLTPGTYYQPIGNNTFQINVAPSSAVPEIDPAGMGSVLALVTGAIGLIERRRLKVA